MKANEPWELWYDSLSLDEKAETLEAFTTMKLKTGIGDFPKFIKLCHKIMEKSRDKKYRRTFKQAEKVGKKILGK